MHHIHLMPVVVCSFDTTGISNTNIDWATKKGTKSYRKVFLQELLKIMRDTRTKNAKCWS